VGTSIRKIAKSLVAIALLTLGACAGQSGDVVLEIEPQSIVTRESDVLARATVEVTDIRKEAQSRKYCIGTLGMIDFRPSEVTIIRELIETKADVLLASQPEIYEPPTILCGIRVFNVATPCTLTYHDLTADIELILRVDERERVISGHAKGRTVFEPGKDALLPLTIEALEELSVALDDVLPDLLNFPSK